LGDPKLQRSNPRDQSPDVIPAAIAKPAFGAFAFFRGKRFCHLSFQCRLNERLNGRADKILVPFQKLLDCNGLRIILNLGHGLLPHQRVGDFDHHLHTMATSLDFAELSAQYHQHTRLAPQHQGKPRSGGLSGTSTAPLQSLR